MGDTGGLIHWFLEPLSSIASRHSNEKKSSTFYAFYSSIFALTFFYRFAVNFLYYGLSLNLDNLSGSLYINFLIGLAVETVGFILGLVLLSRTGRKRLYIVCTFIGAVACLAVNFPVVFGNEGTWTFLFKNICFVLKSIFLFSNVLYQKKKIRKNEIS